MMSFSNLRIVAGIMLTATLAFAHSTVSSEHHHLCAGFLPENNMNIPVGLYSSGGLTEQDFNAVLDRLERLVKDDVIRLGDTLQINRYWSNGTVNASAMRFRNTEIINMYGGLARHPATTIEGFALVACHEFGHHQGGAPKRNIPFMEPWGTNEGGADYYAALKCLRRFFAEDDNVAIVANSQIDPAARAGCESQYSDTKDQALCMRISLAAQSAIGMIQAVKNDPVPARFTTPDTNVVSRTDDNHPKPQCRLDTLFSASLCTVPVSEALSNTDYRQGSCYAPKDSIGTRPLCWFSPR